MFVICAIIAINILLIIYSIYLRNRREQFSNKEEKATAITAWFKKDDTPTYVEFKQNVKNIDVLDYESAKRLHVGGNLNTANLVEKL